METCYGCRYLCQGSGGLNACLRFDHDGPMQGTVLADDPPEPLYRDCYQPEATTWTLEDKIVRFIETYAPDEPHLRQAFIDRLRRLMEEYGRNAIIHGNLPDTEHPHRDLTAENALLRKALERAAPVVADAVPYNVSAQSILDSIREALARIREAKP